MVQPKRKKAVCPPIMFSFKQVTGSQGPWRLTFFPSLAPWMGMSTAFFTIILKNLNQTFWTFNILSLF